MFDALFGIFCAILAVGYAVGVIVLVWYLIYLFLKGVFK